MSTQSVEDRSASSRASSSSAGSGIASIIEGRDNIKDFAALQIEEIDLNVQARRNRIFLLLEEVRRLRVQRRLKSLQGPPPETSSTAANEVNERLKMQAAAESEMVTGAPTTMPFDSALPFLPQLTESKLTDYYLFYVGAVSAVILFGGLVAPILELKLGIGNTSYLDFIRGAHLPAQLAEVDPIVASFRYDDGYTSAAFIAITQDTRHKTR